MLHARIFSDSVSFFDISTFRVDGMFVTVTPGWAYKPCDVAVVYGLANPPRRSAQGRLRNAIHGQHKGPIVVVESSLIGRSFKPRLPAWIATLRKRPSRPRQVHPYYRVAVGGALGDDADFGAVDSPPDRWMKLRSELGIDLKPYRRTGGHVVVIGQIFKDASLRGVNMAAWLQRTARTVQQKSDRPIIIRLHPCTRWRDRVAITEGLANVPGVTISPHDRSLSEDLADAWVCVTLSSGAAVDALIDGIPTICLSPASLAYKICSTSLNDVEQPKEPPREQFLHDLAYSQWSLHELADGTAWRHIQPAVERALARRPPGGGSNEEDVAISKKAWARPERFSPRLVMRSWRRSLATWNTAIRLSPHRPKSLIRRGKALLKQGLPGEAERAFADARKRNPGIVAGHEGAARSAEKLERWDRALDAWTAAHRLSPGRKSPLAGRARALLELGRVEEAATIFADLCQTHPSDKAGFRGFERVAEEQEDWRRALELQEILWKRFGDPDAMRRSTLLLVRLTRLEEAREIVKRLEGEKQASAYVMAAMPLLEATHDWAGMDRLLKAHEDVLLGNWRILQSYVNALGRLGRADEGMRLLARSRAGTPPDIEQLRIACLILMGRHEDAEVCLRRIWEKGSIEEFSAALLSPMMSAARVAGGHALGSFVLDRIDAEAPATRSGLVLRLSAIFQRAALQSVNMLHSDPPDIHDPGPAIEQDCLDTLAESREAMPVGALALQVCERFLHLRRHHPFYFPNPSFVLADALAIAARIVDAVDAKRPYSLVRLGDGEGNLLPYRADLASFRALDGLATRRTWWGGDASVDDDVEVEEELQRAIRCADVVGIPDLERACRTMLSFSETAFSGGGRDVRGLLAAIEFATDRDIGGGCCILTSCHIHQSLSYWGLWDILLPRMGTVSLITCHSDLAEVLANRYRVKVAQNYVVPPERKFSIAFRTVLGEQHYPYTFERLRAKLRNAVPGQVYLVAAGMLGKIYCMWIRQAGGIAIDIGSAADWWCGYQTRSLAAVAMYRPPAGVPERVRNLLEGDRRFSKPLGVEAAIPLGGA